MGGGNIDGDWGCERFADGLRGPESTVEALRMWGGVDNREL